MNTLFSCLNSSLSIKLGKIAAQFTRINDLSFLKLALWIPLAISSFPAQLSPVIRIVESISGTLFATKSVCATSTNNAWKRVV